MSLLSGRVYPFDTNIHTGLTDSKDSAPKNDTSKTGDSPTSSNKSSHSQDSGKSSKLAKVKESVKKHLHHSSK